MDDIEAKEMLLTALQMFRAMYPKGSAPSRIMARQAACLIQRSIDDARRLLDELVEENAHVRYDDSPSLPYEGWAYFTDADLEEAEQLLEKKELVHSFLSLLRTQFDIHTWDGASIHSAGEAGAVLLQNKALETVYDLLKRVPS